MSLLVLPHVALLPLHLLTLPTTCRLSLESRTEDTPFLLVVILLKRQTIVTTVSGRIT